VRKNVYRVLLTRGRDGTVVFVPPEARMDGTYERLLAVGMRELRSGEGMGKSYTTRTPSTPEPEHPQP